MAAALAEGKISGEQFDKAVAATPRAYYETVSEDLDEGYQQCKQLIEVVDERFGADAPSLLSIRKALEDCRALIETTVKEKRKLDPHYVSPEASGQAAEVAAQLASHDTSIRVSGAAAVSLEPTSREDAFQRLAIIADYLKRKEPQNPVSYLVERAVRWSKMPLESWLGEVVQNDEVLGRLRDTLGIRNPQDT
jgi:type VI secretion system protein ImpA